MGILLFVKESEDHSWDRTKERSNSFFCRDQKLNVLLLWFMIYLWWSHRKISFAVSFQITEYILFSIQIIRIIIFTDFVLCFSAKYRLSHQIGIRDPDPRYISSVAVSQCRYQMLQSCKLTLPSWGREDHCQQGDVHHLDCKFSTEQLLINCYRSCWANPIANNFTFNISYGIYQLQSDEVEAICRPLHHRVRSIRKICSQHYWWPGNLGTSEDESIYKTIVAK